MKKTYITPHTELLLLKHTATKPLMAGSNAIQVYTGDSETIASSEEIEAREWSGDFETE